LAAARAGIRVDLFETLPEPAPSAVHVDVVPNFLRCLVSLGVGEACVRRGFPYSGFAVLDSDGRRCDEFAMPRLAGGRWPAATGMINGELQQVLREAALANGVQFQFGTEVVDVRSDGGIVTERGGRHQVDLIVVATGDRLPLFDGSPPLAFHLEALPLQCCYALVPRPRSLERASWIIGRGSLRALQVPVDDRRAGVVVMEAREAPVDHASVRRALDRQGPLLRDLTAHWPEDSDVLLRPVRGGVLDGAWHERGVLRIGSSAHRLMPHFGQSAAQVGEDALVLGSLLRDRLDRNTLLDAFMARRGGRARRVHAVTIQAARWQLRPEAATDLRTLAKDLEPLVAEPP